MFLAIRKRIDSDEEGFTLIELLVVVIIIGILAAIAIPAFLNQRESAWQAAVQSDLRNAAIEAETFYTNKQTYTGFTAADTDDTKMDNTDVAAESFCLVGTSTADAAIIWTYESDPAAPGDPNLTAGSNC